MKGVNPNQNVTFTITPTGFTNPIYSIFKTVLNLLSYAIGFISVVVIIIAGLRMILSGGDPQTLNSARNAIIYAAGGIVIAAIAQIIVVFVLSRF